MIVQNSEWLAWPPPLLRTAVRMSSGNLLDVAAQVFDALLGEAFAFERGVEVRHVGAVMLVVMDLHRLGVDVGLQGIVRVRQVGNV